MLAKNALVDKICGHLGPLIIRPMPQFARLLLLPRAKVGELLGLVLRPLLLLFGLLERIERVLGVRAHMGAL